MKEDLVQEIFSPAIRIVLRNRIDFSKVNCSTATGVIFLALD